MKTELIEREFNFKEIGYDIDVKLTSHLFIRRTINGITDKHIRSHIFKTRAQYQDLLTAAIKKFNLLDYANKGRVSFIFIHKQEKYGMLLDVTKSKDGYTITVITIDKMGDRHFVKNAFFGKEKNKIYTEYVLHSSYMRAIEERVNSCREFVFYNTFFYNRSAQEISLKKKINEYRIHNSIISRFDNKTLYFGRHWIEICNKTDGPIYILINIEKLIVKDLQNIAIIFVDVREEIDRTQITKDIICFPDFTPPKIKVKSKTGLRIKKKLLSGKLS